MRNVSLDRVDRLPVSVLPIATDYAPGHLLAWHEHRRAQFLYAASGTMLVETRDGAWTVPGERAVLIPPRTRHQVRMLDVQTNSLYIEPRSVPWWPERCEVVEVPDLLRELLRAAADIDAGALTESRSQAVSVLLLHELAALVEVPMSVPFPEDVLLAGLCRRFMSAPDLRVDNRAWALEARMSERSLTRRFRAQTGMSPAAWRAKALLLAAIPLLAHRTVTDVAGALGYSSPAAFSYAFHRAFDVTPISLRQ
ncbi:helix-turn-helix domain-containing protein [Microbacterium sp. NPDC089698]|uniref:helix-turn-helix domain-containing protein n=1 Tax=Microbacterium sp. NPDC089698 TaxID=3364200 RepID=UPI003814A88E